MKHKLKNEKKIGNLVRIYHKSISNNDFFPFFSFSAISNLLTSHFAIKSREKKNSEKMTI